MNSSSHLTRSTSTLIRGRSQTPSWSQRRIGFTESAGKTHLLNKNSRGANLYFHPHFRHVFFRRGGERLRYITYIYIYTYTYTYTIYIFLKDDLPVFWWEEKRVLKHIINQIGFPPCQISWSEGSKRETALQLTESALE